MASATLARAGYFDPGATRGNILTDPRFPWPMTAKPTVVSLGDRFEDHARVGVVIELKGDQARVEWSDKSKASWRTWVGSESLIRSHTRAASSGDLSARLVAAEAELGRLRKLVDGEDSWAAMAMRYGLALERALEVLRSISPRAIEYEYEGVPSPWTIGDAVVLCSAALAGPSQQLGLLDGPDPLEALRAAVRSEACLNIHRGLIRMLVEGVP